VIYDTYITNKGYEFDIVGILMGYTLHIRKQLAAILIMGTVQMAKLICKPVMINHRMEWGTIFSRQT
jgi:hypothetical protein